MTKHFLIYGEVQGVGYRRFAQRIGHELGLRGWVRNLYDGRVELVAEGSPETLDALQKHLHNGPPLAVIQKIEVIEKAVTISKGAFVILDDGEDSL